MCFGEIDCNNGPHNDSLIDRFGSARRIKENALNSDFPTSNIDLSN
jgi:hypothetical protein